MKLDYVIFSFAETKNEIDHEPMFWNNNDGWGSLSTATRFPVDILEKYLPNDGMAVQLPTEEK